MKSLNLLFFSLTCLIFCSQKSEGQVYSWARSINSNSEVRTETVTSDRSEGITAVSYFYDTVTVSGKQLVSRGDKDILIVQYNENGDTLWSKHIGSKDEDRAKDIVSDDDGNLFITGSVGDSALFDGRYIRTYHGQDIFLTKLTSDGDSLWIKNVGKGYNIDRGNGLTLSGNKIHMIGFFDDTLFLGSDTLISNGFTNNFYATFNIRGEYLSSMKVEGFHDKARLNSISAAQDGGVLISGFYYDTIRFTDPSETEYEFFSRSSGNPDIIVFRFFPDQTLAWGRTAGSPGRDQGMDAKSDIEGNIYLTGFFGGPSDFDSTETLQSAILPHVASDDIFIAKYNSQGRLLWKKAFGGKGSDIARRLDYFDSKVVFTGHFSDTIIAENDTLATTGTSDNDTGFGLSNDGGDFISFSQIMGDGIDRGMAITNDIYGAVYIVGFYRSSELFVGDDTLVNSNPGVHEGFVAKGVWPLSLAITDQVNVSCKDSADATVTVTPYFGDPPFSFSWEHDGGLTDSVATGLSAGNYKVICTDDIGQIDSLIITVTEPSTISIDHSITDVTCSGYSNGEIDITPGGGTPGYSYNWEAISGVLGRPSTDQDQIGLTNGSFKITVSDANGCLQDSTFTVIEPPVLETSISGTDVTGAGGNGTIDLTVTGGTPAYSYSWTGPNGYTNTVDQDPEDLDGGTYYVTVTDDNACEAENNITLAEPGVLTTTFQKTDILCNGDSTGSIIVTPSDGVQPYQYKWSHDGGFSDSIATDLPAGYYEIVVEDDNLVTDTVKVTLIEPDKLQHSVNASNISCFGFGDGKVDLVISGGTLPYSYEWSTGATTQNIADVGPGVYQGIITDVNGCKDTADAIVLQPSQLAATSTVTQITCNGYRDGKIVLDVLGGSPPYEYLWSNTLTTDSVDYLLPGNYWYEVTDLNGCQETDIIAITEPDPITGVFTDLKPSCFGFSNGEARVVPSGGSGTYSYLWDDLLNQTTALATNLPSGDYVVNITDDNGCEGTADTSIAQNSQIIVINDSIDDILCPGFTNGAVYTTVSGGSPSYTYLWSNNVTTEDLMDVGPGTYSLTVTDAANCQTPAGPYVVQDLSTPIVITNQQATDVSCYGGMNGMIYLSTWDSPKPHKYSIDNGATYQTDTVFYDLSAGSYIPVVIDTINGCLEYGDILSVGQPAGLLLESIDINRPTHPDSANGVLTIHAVGGTPIYQFSVNSSDFQLDSVFMSRAAGTDTIVEY